MTGTRHQDCDRGPRARRCPELLAPAGDWDCAKAAVENGADAIYFGLTQGMNARHRATNFATQDLAALMHMLRLRGVKGYVTLNTLVFSGELDQAERTVRAVAAAGVDAVLVQDLGLARLIRQVCPDLPLHASTQMTLTSAQGIQAAQQLGVERVVLARELSLDEIRRIRRQTSLELEVFVHGALCVAYSGQCLTSESLGGRSANRGHCAQACRLPYQLVCDGHDVELGARKYLLSPQDLAAFPLLPELISAGVDGLKIEGRLKTAEYVANITHHYRQALDRAWAGEAVELTPQQVQEMELSFSRGFSPGWLQGCDHKMLVPGLSSAKRGIYLGQVTAIQGRQVLVRLAAPVSRGDGVVFAGDRQQQREQGGRVYAVLRDGQPADEPVRQGVVALTFGRRDLDLGQLWIGQDVWKTDDPQLTRRLRKTFTSPDPLRRVALDLEVEAIAGQPLRIAGHADSGAQCQLWSSKPLEPAVRHPLSAELLWQQLGRLGGSVYALRRLKPNIAGQPMVPLSILGQLRHEMIRQLDASVSQPPRRRLAAEGIVPSLRAALLQHAQADLDPATSAPPAFTPGAGALCDSHAQPPRLRVLCRQLQQLRAAITCHVDGVIMDLQDIRQYREAVELARGAGLEIHLATPRIEKPKERGIFRVLLRHAADGILVRNLSGLQFFAEQGMATTADFSLNAANELTVQYLRQQGAQRVTVSYDLNRDQLLELVAATPPSWLEVVVHQQMPMFHMEHCVFCAMLSPGTNKTNCGRPCDRHTVRLRDRVGMEHLLLADVGCRNTLFNAVAQSGAEAAPTLVARGVRDFRVELLDQSDRQVKTTLALYRDLLDGRISGREVWTRLNVANRVGVTRGTLEQSRDPLAIL